MTDPFWRPLQSVTLSYAELQASALELKSHVKVTWLMCCTSYRLHEYRTGKNAKSASQRFKVLAGSGLFLVGDTAGRLEKGTFFFYDE